MKQFFILFFAAIVFFGCQNKRSDTKYYYALDSLIDAQSTYLVEVKANLNKEAWINGKTEKSSYTPENDTTWRYELEVFAGLNDVNKPTNVGKYRTAKDVKDANSNLLVYAIESTEDLPVDYLRIYYLNDLSKIRKIEGVFSEENSLLKGSRKMTMEFQEIDNKIVLTSYSLQGGQKMLLGDSVSFSVHGNITLP